jgi:DNA polymerase V
MSVLDEINARWGRGTLRTGSVPIDPDWALRRDLMSRSYTTRLDQLWVFRAD